MNNRLTARLIAALALVTLTAAAVAKQPEAGDRVWMVALTDPATLEFEGGIPQAVTSSRTTPAKAFEPTAPSVTGVARFDVRAESVQRYAAYLDERRAKVLQAAADALGRPIRPRFVYRHLFNGFAARMSAAEAERLRRIPGVRSVEPEIIQHVQTDAGPQWINAPEMWSGSTGAPNPNRGEGMVLGVVDTGVNWDSVFFDPNGPSALPVTNPRGQFFGLCNDETLDIPCNDKLIGVYDFTDEETNGFDPDGHGSHVASTAVGFPLNSTLDFGSGPISFPSSGVAPRASFIAYKACQAPEDDTVGNFQCPGSATSAALEQAIEDQVDVVNFSIGGDPFDPWATFGNQSVFRNMRAAGIVPVTSAGNSGPAESTVGSPANTPWTLAVANNTHGRILANRLVDVAGGPFVLGELIGEGITDGTSTIRPIVHASEFGNALCGTGPAELGPSCEDNTGASSPFEPGTFSGQIVVCDRGTYGRVEKGKNVLEAGAGGMILANTDAQGESTVADQHCLPAMHVGDTDGDRLRNWLASGSGHQGRLTGTDRAIVDERAGLMAESSSRGPTVGAPDVMKPNVSAPGTNIYAASTDFDAETNGPGPDARNRIAFLTGTSMSSPHVAGAALLLRAAHPDWGVSEVISALETTADPGITRLPDGSDARVIDRGAGGVQVDQAAQIGLFLPVTDSEFVNANPGIGGNPGTLNLPGVFSDNCGGGCSFERTVEALQGGSWTVSTEGPLDIQVEPGSFSLAAGERQTLEISIDKGDVLIGAWGAGSVVLSPSNVQLATQRLPVGAFLTAGEVPGAQSFQTQTNRGRGEIDIEELAEIPELVFRTSALQRPEVRNTELAQDPTRDDPFDDDQGTVTEFVNVPEGALWLSAQTLISDAADIDLFVGRDTNGDGQAQGSEVECDSISPDEIEECEFETPVAGTWWIRVQSFTSGTPGQPDEVPWQFSVLVERDDPSLVVAGPGFHPGGPLTVPIYWDQPAMLENQRWVGAVAVSTAPDFLANVGVIPVSLSRTQQNLPDDTALFEGQTLPVVMPENSVHDRLFIDVPASARRIDVMVDGPMDNVTLRRRPFSALADSVPETPPAPDAVLAQGQQDGDGWTVSVDPAGSSTLDPGRYFVVLENDQSEETRVEVTVEVTENARIEAGRGLWSAANRPEPIRQGVDFQVGGGGQFAVWYTYDEAGLPTFFISDTVPVEPDSSFFHANLLRATSNDERLRLNVVGEIQITNIAEDRFMYAWRLKGNHGAEMFDPVSVIGTGCPLVNGQPRQMLGHWFSPTTSAGGVTLLVTDSAEAWIRYYYDDLDEPRWVIADEEVDNSNPVAADSITMEVLDFRGWCIYCEQTPITIEPVGTLERDFIDQSTVREITDFVAGAPLNASVDIDREIARISNVAGCPNQ